MIVWNAFVSGVLFGISCLGAICVLLMFALIFSLFVTIGSGDAEEEKRCE